jgi:hypothetical protein
MLGFEPFDVRAWMHEGMTEQVISGPVTTVARSRGKSRLAKFLVASAVGIGVVQLSLFSETAGAAMQWRAPLGYAVSSQSNLIDLVADGHWEKLLAKMKTWRPLEEPGASFDVDPLA